MDDSTGERTVRTKAKGKSKPMHQWEKRSVKAAVGEKSPERGHFIFRVIKRLTVRCTRKRMV
ncbi:MAG: hypothetical protein ACXAB6_06950 [Candidatus Thorarchaeota archaeon]|jgi:hypothetical protein